MSSIVIKKDIIINNLDQLKKDYDNYTHRIVSMANDAYNHGIIFVKELIEHGVTSVTVNNLNEGINIRKYDKNIDIIILSEVDKDDIYDAIVNNLIIVVSSMDYLKDLYNLELKDKLYIHLEVDSGTNNFGIKSKNLFKNAIEIIKNHKYLELDGVFSNLEKIADNYEEYIEEFKTISSCYNLSKLNYCYLLGKNVIYNNIPSFFNGIDFNNNIYGINTIYNNLGIIDIIKNKFNNRQKKYEFVLGIEIISKLSNVKKVKAEEKIYGFKSKIKEDIMVGTINVGYFYGINKKIKEVLVNNNKRKVLAVLENKMIIQLEKDDKVGSIVTIINGNTENLNHIFFEYSIYNLQKKYIN